MMGTKAKKITSGDIHVAMSKRWADPEYALMWEVAEATGMNSGRRADAVIVSLWPSRGLEIHGVEIKISRADWRREAADPTKAEAISKYCDRWWVHTSPDVVDDISDMPPAWGLREWNGSRWKTRKEAEKTEAQPVTRQFLASLLRRADGTMQRLIAEAHREGRAKVHDELESQRENFAKLVKQEVERRTARQDAKFKRLEEFEAAFGSLDQFRDYRKLGEAAQALDRCNSHMYAPLANKLRDAATAIEMVNNELILEPPQ